jgi:hypothetical protein
MVSWIFSVIALTTNRWFFYYICAMSKSLELARPYLGKKVTVTMDRPLGSKHPKWGFVYEVNYGHIPHTLAPDGAELDAYFLGTNEPLKVLALLLFTALKMTMINWWLFLNI